MLSEGYQDADAVCKHQRQTALHVAAEWGYCDLLSVLLRHSRHVDASDAMGHTALLVAAASGESEPLALLAQAGASLNHEDSSGGQALHLAATNGHASVLSQLCALGALPQATDRKGRTALDLVRRQERFYAGQRLGARFHTKNDEFHTKNDGFRTETDVFYTKTDGRCTEYEQITRHCRDSAPAQRPYTRGAANTSGFWATAS